MADTEGEPEKEPPPPPVNITVHIGFIPPPKKPKVKASFAIPPPEPERPEGEEGEEGETAAEPPQEPPAEEEKPPEEEPPPPQPRSVLVNCNVPVLILLHHVRKCYMREEPQAAADEGVEISDPPTDFDLATPEGQVLNLGVDCDTETRASEKVEARATYVLVRRVPGEEEGAPPTFKCLCPIYKDVEFAG
eukprot:CAMPEP_0174917726 /NCGR_PEP_ID=MMETSP1355-20121228/2646_1 /TAXON_ID=464990 /ORGANISM="Hemiselmis tepida, Strain CCMP443" /LENGTH=190 /DNA_ID=CAMNT_0016162851 /DNA_START=90 /DNA_END=662 /DNA_ORIENTATION=-